MNKRQRKVCEKLGWKVTDCGNEIELETFSPAGENFLFYAQRNNFAESIADYADNFDSDEHAEFWVEFRGKRGVPHTIRELIDDADAIKQMLTDLSEQINKLKRR